MAIGGVEALEIGDAACLRRCNNRPSVHIERRVIARNTIVGVRVFQRTIERVHARNPPAVARLLGHHDFARGARHPWAVEIARDATRREESHAAGYQVHAHEITPAAFAAHRRGGGAVGRGIGITHRCAACDAAQRPVLGAPEKEVRAQRPVVKWHEPRHEKMAVVGHPARCFVRRPICRHQRNDVALLGRVETAVGYVLGVVPRLEFPAPQRGGVGFVGRTPHHQFRRRVGMSNGERHEAAIGRDGRIARAAVESLDECPVHECVARKRAIEFERVCCQLRDEATIQLTRTSAVDADERFIKGADRLGGHALPERGDAGISFPAREPFKVCRAHEVGEAAGFPPARGAHRAVRWETALDGELSKDGGTPRVIGASTAGDSSFDVRRVALEDPARRVRRDGTEGHRRERPEKALPAIARRPREVRDMRELVRRQHLTPNAKVSDFLARIRRCGVEDDRRRVERGPRTAVGGVDGIVHHDRDTIVGQVSHHCSDLGAHSFHTRGQRERPLAVLLGIVHHEVRRGDRLPIEPRTDLRRREPGREQQEAESSACDGRARKRKGRVPARAPHPICVTVMPKAVSHAPGSFQAPDPAAR